jgi:NADPH-dependent 2,4-dienoyl-CoA reductase/sulfur reductase-like enzyme
MSRIVVIGGVAAGMSAASQAKRRQPHAEVIALERGIHVSYGACGMPYNIADPGRNVEDLVVITAERFRRERNLDLRLRHEAASLDAGNKSLHVRDLEARREYELGFDKLVIATGAEAVTPPLPGLDLPGVFVLRDLTHAVAIRDHLQKRSPRRAIIIGAGYIGLEMAESFVRRGLDVTVLEMMEQIVPGWHTEIAQRIGEELERNGVHVRTGIAVEEVAQAASGAALEVTAGGERFPADIVLVAVGVRPTVHLARKAGLALGKSGAIAVDDHQRTSAADIFAAGDCAEAYHRILGRPVWIPLGDTANKEGKVAGANATGDDETFPGIVGSAGFKVFDLEVARTGLGTVEIEELGGNAIEALSRHPSFAHGYPGAKPLTTVVFAEAPSGRVLGVQMVGAGTVATRVDVWATALHAGMTVGNVEGLDLVYAPPLSPVYDPILIAATVARKQVAKAARPGG